MKPLHINANELQAVVKIMEALQDAEDDSVFCTGEIGFSFERHEDEGPVFKLVFVNDSWALVIL